MSAVLVIEYFKGFPFNVYGPYRNREAAEIHRSELRAARVEEGHPFYDDFDWQIKTALTPPEKHELVPITASILDESIEMLSGNPSAAAIETVVAMLHKALSGVR